MPNWCANFIRVTHENPDMVGKLGEAFKKGNVASTFVPKPEGITDWYQWNVANWGTKWDFGSALDDIGDDVVNGMLEGFFDTAWSPPIPVYEKLVELGYEVTAFYHEGGMCFAGEWENGNSTEYNNISSATLNDMSDEIVDLFALDAQYRNPTPEEQALEDGDG